MCADRKLNKAYCLVFVKQDVHWSLDVKRQCAAHQHFQLALKTTLCTQLKRKLGEPVLMNHVCFCCVLPELVHNQRLTQNLMFYSRKTAETDYIIQGRWGYFGLLRHRGSMWPASGSSGMKRTDRLCSGRSFIPDRSVTTCCSDPPPLSLILSPSLNHRNTAGLKLFQLVVQ